MTDAGDAADFVQARIEASYDERRGEFPKPKRRDGKEPCGECHLLVGETCDICGASWSARDAA